MPTGMQARRSVGIREEGADSSTMPVWSSHVGGPHYIFANFTFHIGLRCILGRGKTTFQYNVRIKAGH